MSVLRQIKQYLSYIVVVSFISWENGYTTRKKTIGQGHVVPYKTTTGKSHQRLTIFCTWMNAMNVTKQTSLNFQIDLKQIYDLLLDLSLCQQIVEKKKLFSYFLYLFYIVTRYTNNSIGTQ